MKDITIQASDLRDIDHCIDEIMRLRAQHPKIFAPIETEIMSAATALVSISAKCTKEQRKAIFGDDKR